MHTGFCLLSITWIKIKGMICVPIMFCPLTVEHMGNLSVHPTVQDMDLRNMDLCHGDLDQELESPCYTGLCPLWDRCPKSQLRWLKAWDGWGRAWKAWFLCLRGHIWSLKGQIEGLGGLIQAWKGWVIWGLRGLIWGLRELIWGQRRLIWGLRGLILGLRADLGSEKANMGPQRLEGRGVEQTDKWT